MDYLVDYLVHNLVVNLVDYLVHNLVDNLVVKLCDDAKYII